MILLIMIMIMIMTKPCNNQPPEMLTEIVCICMCIIRNGVHMCVYNDHFNHKEAHTLTLTHTHARTHAHAYICVYLA